MKRIVDAKFKFLSFQLIKMIKYAELKLYPVLQIEILQKIKGLSSDKKGN